MPYLLFLLFCTFAVNLALAVFVFFKNPKKSRNVVFALFGIGTAGWNLSLYFALSGFDPLIWWGRLPFSFGALMAASLLWFVHDFPSRTKHFKFWSVLSLVSGVIFFTLPLTPWMLRSVDVSQGYITGDLNPSVYPLWVLFFLISLTYSLIRSWISLRREKGLQKSQGLAVVMGLTMFWVPVLVTNTILPLIGLFQWNSLGPVFTIFFLAFVAHAILRYRFLEIRWVFKRTLDIVFLWLIAFGIIFTFQVSFERSGQITLVQLLSALTIAFIYLPVSRYILSLTAKLAARGTYETDSALDAIDEISRSVDELETLQRQIAGLFTSFFGYQKVYILTCSSRDQRAVSAHRAGYKDSVATVTPDVLRFVKKTNAELIEASEIGWQLENDQVKDGAGMYRKLHVLLEEHDVDTVVPFVVGKWHVGFALLGDKKDAKLLTNRDVEMVHRIQASISPAMANAARLEDMRQLYDELKEADKIKGEFIDVVSHQFRTPLTAIMWDVELAMDLKPKPAAVRDGLLNIKQRANFLRTVLYQMFDLLELENNKMQFENEPIELDPILQEVTDRNKSYCKEHDICVDLDLTPTKVMADRRHLISALEAIVENACDYSGQGKAVKVITEIDKDKNEAVIYVQDTGIGMNKATLKNLFKKFYRGKDAKKMSPNGTGIALYLAKESLRRMHGSITVDSAPGKGTLFTLRIPRP